MHNVSEKWRLLGFGAFFALVIWMGIDGSPKVKPIAIEKVAATAMPLPKKTVTIRDITPPAVVQPTPAKVVAKPVEKLKPAKLNSSDLASEIDTSGYQSEWFESGIASYYGHELAGERTASGERFNPEGLTAAHPTLPLGSHVRVTNTRNGRSIVVRVNDRGPFAAERVIDLSRMAAAKLGIVRRGTAMVRLDLLTKKTKDGGNN